MSSPGAQVRGLKRSLGLGLLVLYGLGTIVGAGIYILLGEVAADTGMAMPLAFVGAGLLAVVTGLAYAELAARFPEAAGASAYVAEGLGSPMAARITGLLVLFTGLVIAASLARGAASYASVFVSLPEPVVSAGVVVVFTAVACLGVRQSVGIAALLTAVELLGLVLVCVAGAPSLMDLPWRFPEIVPDDLRGWNGVAIGTFAAFFAYIGFESLANIAEEAKNPQRDLPRAIVISIVLSSAIYVGVSLVVVLTVPMERLAGSTSALAMVMEGATWGSPAMIAAIALVAVPNGLLADVLMTSRLLYGMARRGLAPSWLATVTAGTRAPLPATLFVGAATLLFSILLPFGQLVAATSALTLLIFLLVHISLWRLHARRLPHTGIRAPRWVPPVGAALCFGLLCAELASWIVKTLF